MQRRVVDEVIRVDRGVALPAERGEVGETGRRQQDEALDAARVQNRVEAVEPDALRPDLKTLDLEAELVGAFGNTLEQRLVVADHEVGAVRVDDLERGEHAAELLAAGTPQLGHDCAGEWIALVARLLGGGAHEFDGGGLHARRAAQRIGNGRSGEAKRTRQRPQSRRGGGHRGERRIEFK